MPRVIIDQRPIEVAPGTKVISAAEQLGIMIPRFCFHPALGAVGACRVCAVKFVDGPVKGIQMSCMIDCHDGMVVSTTDAEAVDFRRHVIEWLMLNHPHDCPVCDEGGHCLLQDMTVAGGHGRRRFPGPKRTHLDQYLGPLLQHEMNRCIQCYRCSRFYQEFTGYRDLGVLGIAAGVYFGRYQDGILQSPFSGNLADICPTGVFTDKPSRYCGRRWDYQRSPGLCLSCSLGCHTVVNARYRQVVRQEARFSPEVNGHFICDRGRHAYVYAADSRRPRHARVDGRQVGLTDALKEATKRLQAIQQRHGAGSIACWGSARSDLLAMAALTRLADTHQWRRPVFFSDAATSDAVRASLPIFTSRVEVSLQTLATSDVILAVGIDPLAEAPMLALAMRQAARRGAAIVIMDPRPLDLPFDFKAFSLPQQQLETALAHLVHLVQQIREAPPSGDAGGNQSLRNHNNSIDVGRLAHQLLAGRQPVIVYGSNLADAPVVRQCHHLAACLQERDVQAGVFPVLPGTNALGAALLSDPRVHAEQLVNAMQSGRVRALIVVEGDPLQQFYDRARLEAALKQLELLIVMDYVNSGVVDAAHIVLPTTTVYESGGIFINQEGRAQWALPAFSGGRPILQTSGGRHPPRIYGAGLPDGEPRPARDLLTALASEEPAEVQTADLILLPWLVERDPFFAPLAAAQKWPEQGSRLHGQPRDLPAGETTEDQAGASPPESEEVFELLPVESLFGSEELSVFSPQLQELESPPLLGMADEDARRLGLTGGDQVRIETGAGTITIRISVSPRTAAGCLILPRHRQLNWQQLQGRRQTITAGQIKKA